MNYTFSTWYKPTATTTNDRILASNRSKQDAHLVVNSSNVLGYYKAGVFTALGGGLVAGEPYRTSTGVMMVVY